MVMIVMLVVTVGIVGVVTVPSPVPGTADRRPRRRTKRAADQSSSCIISQKSANPSAGQAPDESAVLRIRFARGGQQQAGRRQHSDRRSQRAALAILIEGAMIIGSENWCLHGSPR